MASTIRIKTSLKNDVTTVKAIIRHPMETGFRIDQETGKLIPAHYIKLVTIKHNGKLIMSCDWTRALSKNPYLSFMFNGASIGDELELSWLDTKNETDSMKVLI